MNKTELVSAIATEAKLTKVQAKEALEATLKTITEALAKGDKVALIGFGTFAVNKRPERMGRNPRTGEQIKIESKNVVKFNAGADLNDKI